jgi:hypothetical protein
MYTYLKTIRWTLQASGNSYLINETRTLMDTLENYEVCIKYV